MQDGPTEILKTAAYSYPYDPPAYSGKPREERQKFHFSPPFSHSRANAAQYPGYVRRRGEGGKNRAAREMGGWQKKEGEDGFYLFFSSTMIAGGLSFPSRTYHEKVDSDQAKGVQKGIVFGAGGSRKRHQHYCCPFPSRHIHVRAHKSPGIPPPLLPIRREVMVTHTTVLQEQKEAATYSKLEEEAMQIKVDGTKRAFHAKYVWEKERRFHELNPVVW